MGYNFDEVINRKGTNSVKWDLCANDVLPMWVADMDFKTAPEITQALTQMAAKGIYGYTLVPDDFYSAVILWLQKQHKITITKDSILATPGVLPSLSAIIRTFVKKDESVILQTPVYNHFFYTLENYGCGILQNDMIYENESYHINFTDLEEKAANPKAKLLLISNPHNPLGRVYSQAELERICEICAKHQVILVSDEIHSDLVFSSQKHIPLTAIAKSYNVSAITCASPCKTFNMSGLAISYIVSKSKDILQQVQKTLDTQDTLYPNMFAVQALIAAYNFGDDWLTDLKKYLYKNYEYLLDFFHQNMPQLKVVPLNATYLVWVDCNSLHQSSEKLSQLLIEQEKLWLNAGTMYGTSGEGFLRINIACPKAVLTDGLERLKKFYDKNISL